MNVSIIIPTYNRLWCLPHAIDSCRNTKCKTEIIVVDDGSTDDTWEWLSQQKDLTIIKQNHLGKCWAANRGFEIATGKYIRFLDSDDLLTKGVIDEQFQLAEDQHSDVVVSGYQIIDQQENLVHKQLWLSCNDFVAQQLGECDGSHYSAFLFTRELLLDIPHRPDYAFRDDRMLILEVAIKNPKLAVHSGYALLHRAHESDRLQFTSGLQHSVQNHQHLAIYRYIIDRLKSYDALTYRRISAAINILWPLSHWMAKHHLNDAIRLFNWIKELDPEFKFPEKGGLLLAYRILGFKKTQQLLRLRRLLKPKWL
ncbi:glycosyltransferase family 2 protein [Pedobacter hiemivivus]|uniref:Glycosyltransferase family 2 protein n=1 Tax=Pedobacter hiemivivus TaxID=2530454 RepID=A0A4U1GDF1_9SPHI|nr:glycosyltransferase family 2 protein [Pedobacter hiemivivus]TKC60960.1 glycosyltransferase family 2 protein [Pedobacter hiemivivus]